MTFSASGVITLTTDIGHKGPFVASMKGVMLSRFPAARILDLTHEVVVHWSAEAGFWLSRAYPYFPRGTVHLAVVDPGVGTKRDIIFAEVDGHVFIAPDNGLLAPLTAGPGVSSVHRLDMARLHRFGLHEPSATFHGRDILAPLAAEIAAGRSTVVDVGPLARDIVPSLVDEPQVTGDAVTGIVIALDNFGNLITNIDRKLVEHFARPVVIAGSHTLPLLRTYGDVRPGDYLALVNSFGVVEIARAEQSASEGLGLERGAPIVVTERPRQD